MKTHKAALVVLSGGQDSITCLGLALAQYPEVHAIGFRYGQRHAAELECAALVCGRHDVPFRIVDVPALSELVTSALTGTGDVAAAHGYKPGLPASFVPARNALFLTLAHGYAQELDVGTLLTGVSEADYSGYPDCRETFIRMIALALNVGYETDIDIRTPLMHLGKAEVFALARRFNFFDTVIEDSLTCYNGKLIPHEWGYGCDECPSCDLRRIGYFKFLHHNFNRELVEQAVIG